MFTRTIGALLASSLFACSAPFASAVDVAAQGSDAAPSAPVDAPDSALGRTDRDAAADALSEASSAVDAALSTDTSAPDSGASQDAGNADASNTLPPDSGHSTSTSVWDIQPKASFEAHTFSMPQSCVIVASGCDTQAGLTLDREYRPIVGSAGGTLQCNVTNPTSSTLTLTMWITCAQ